MIARMKSLPSPQRMYRALVERDRSYDGAFFAAIRTTGIFCRPGCGARRPLRDNVEFFETSSSALRSGYRPCKRCRPLELCGAQPVWVRQLFTLVADATERIDSAALRRAGIHPARAARWFKEHFGMTFQAFQRARRVGSALRPLSSGAGVSSAALSSGFESESGFRAAFEDLFGAAPTKLAAAPRELRLAWLPTPLGPLLAAACDEGLCFLDFVDRRALATQVRTLRRRVAGSIVPGEHRHLTRVRDELERYFAGTLREFRVPLFAPGTEFQQRVWTQLRAIPYGATCSYGELARAIGAPTSMRAVANTNGLNRLAIVIPCHRVIGSDGKLVGYGGGLWRKQRLLELESGSAKHA